MDAGSRDCSAIATVQTSGNAHGHQVTANIRRSRFVHHLSTSTEILLMKDDFWNQTAFWMSELVINGHAMQICGLEVKESAGGTRRLLGTLADGESTIRALLKDKYISNFDRQKLSSNDIIKITKAQSTKLNEEMALSVFEFEVVGKYTGVDLLETTEPPRKKPATVAAVRSYKGLHTGKHDAPISPSECAMSQELC
jgi:hypothetical protein